MDTEQQKEFIQTVLEKLMLKMEESLYLKIQTSVVSELSRLLKGTMRQEVEEAIGKAVRARLIVDISCRKDALQLV